MLEAFTRVLRGVIEQAFYGVESFIREFEGGVKRAFGCVPKLKSQLNAITLMLNRITLTTITHVGAFTRAFRDVIKWSSVVCDPFYETSKVL